ncbi:glucarate dehydratase family protein [Streptomyces sp. NPDC101175]|uniref:glucarate dehydratase family protein n=1 Tax=Streptomyces sp. NPDC101175 TaxID=3366123 RepID=UPI0038376696
MNSTTTGTRIRELIVTPIAFRDPPLLNSNGVHEPLALRCVLQLVLEDGTVGLGESTGGAVRLERLEAAAKAVVGRDVFDTTALAAAIDEVLLPTVPSAHERGWTTSAVEVACLDAQGKLLGRPVSDLLGGKVRDRVPFAAYLFYKWAEHPALDGRPAVGDDWGAALDPAGIVEQARLMQQRFGFRSFKLKGGVFPPDEEIAAIRALAEAFPGQPLRLDPNTAWTPDTSSYVARELDGVLEYLEDPTATIPGMAEVAKDSPLPLATNMCVIASEHLKPAIEQNAIQVLLTDHHYWGGLRRTRELAAVCEAFGIPLSMHSNSHLGISLAAMTHVAAAIPNLDHSCDTHYPWNKADDIVVPGVLELKDGAVEVPTGPGLGVELDHDALERLHRLYLDSGMRTRDDTGYMRRVQPDYELKLPRW